ncbi:AI-2E family transporter [Bradyrhizobium sp. ORS 111]|uniref:AI-2E family transporter n=1 Tax=Bradyrhizobium sp. ORS 111 TaxID=1685958 RepID=UPI00388ED7F2
MAPGPSADESVPAASGPTVTSILSLQVGAVVVTALYFAREVLVPITVAILLSFVLSPLVNLLRRLRLGRVPSVLMAALLAIAVIALIGTVVGTQVAQLAGKAPEYAVTIEKKVESVRGYALDKLSGVFERAGYNPKLGSPQRSAEPPGSAGAPVEQGGQPQGSGAPATTPVSLLRKYLSPVLSPFATLGIIVVVAIFLLLQKEDLRDRMIRLFGSTDLHRTTVAMDDAAKRLSRYFLAQLGLNTAFGIVIGVGLVLIGVPNPILWAILSGLLRFVPYIGSFISAVLPTALAAAVDPGWSIAIWTIALYVIVELCVSQGVEPILYGHSTGLSPFAVVVSAIFWSWLWGSVGLVLSMPLTLCLVVLGRYVDRLEFLDVLLGDRPPLTPVESFYQRILAGDADEAQDHAELLLKERSLSSYYDEVALKGLQLAANDARRGVIGHRQLEKVRNTIEGLIDELADYDDRDPPRSEQQPAGVPKDQRQLSRGAPPLAVSNTRMLVPGWRGPTPVLCLAGKGPLDDSAAAMLAQLLEKHGLGAKVASYQAASRDAIATLDLIDVAMICISYLDIRGNPSHLRYLLQRLRRRANNIPILVGLWPADEEVLQNDKTRAEVGADYYVTSLREAVDACVEEAEKGTMARPRLLHPTSSSADKEMTRTDEPEIH